MEGMSTMRLFDFVSSMLNRAVTLNSMTTRSDVVRLFCLGEISYVEELTEIPAIVATMDKEQLLRTGQLIGQNIFSGSFSVYANRFIEIQDISLQMLVDHYHIDDIQQLISELFMAMDGIDNMFDGIYFSDAGEFFVRYPRKALIPNTFQV